MLKGGSEPQVLKGIEMEDYPKWVKFGKIQISPYALYFKHKLAVTDHQGRRMGGFISRNLSPHMVDIFCTILKNEKPDLTKMTPDEAIYYNSYLRKANLHRKFPTHDHIPDELKRRITILEGSIDAGNDNVKLKQELRQIAHYLNAYGCITHKECAEYIKNRTYD